MVKSVKVPSFVYQNPSHQILADVYMITFVYTMDLIQTHPLLPHCVEGNIDQWPAVA